VVGRRVGGGGHRRAVDRAREQRHEPEAQQRAAALARRREVRENLRTKDPRAASDAGPRAPASWRVGPAAGLEGRTSMQSGYSRASGASASPPPAASGISSCERAAACPISTG